MSNAVTESGRIYFGEYFNLLQIVNQYVTGSQARIHTEETKCLLPCMCGL